MLTLLSVLLAAASPPTPDITGNWDLRANDSTILRLEIVKTPAGTTAIWDRPEHFNTDGESFSRISGPVIRRQARSIKSIDGDIELSFDDPAPGATPDVFRLHRVNADHVKVTYEGTGFDPFDFVRAQPRSPGLGPWDADRSYVRTIARPTNVEMTAIFDADQADRHIANIDWSIVGPADKKRRARTQQLLDSGALQSGEDFYNAAFVFQHGSEPDDFLKAHLLAIIAIARGKPGAVWIAAATLDRYLLNIGKPQVLGTQFRLPKDTPVTQEPYDRALVSDAMRNALHVPSIAEQEARRRRDEERASAARQRSN